PRAPRATSASADGSASCSRSGGAWCRPRPSPGQSPGCSRRPRPRPRESRCRWTAAGACGERRRAPRAPPRAAPPGAVERGRAGREVWSGDVLVAGGGSAGCSAAVSAAREGARTLLVEAGGFLGGTGAAVLDTFYGFYAPGAGERVVGGVGWELCERLLAAGQA